MPFLTSHMEAMLSAATDPDEIEMRRKVLEDQLAMERALSAQASDASALTGSAADDADPAQ